MGKVALLGGLTSVSFDEDMKRCRVAHVLLAYLNGADSYAKVHIIDFGFKLFDSFKSVS